MAQTSVEWLVKKAADFFGPHLLPELIIEQAKEKHKEEIKKAWLAAWKYSMINPLEDKYYEPEAENYYNETFNK